MMTLGIDEIARLAAEKAKKEQNQTDDGFNLGTGRRPPLHSTSKEKVSFNLQKFQFQLMIYVIL